MGSGGVGTTWVERKLSEGDDGLMEIDRHVMDLYAAPLAAYLRATPWRSVGRADEIVQRFFSDRLRSGDFLARWSQSGTPVRRWIVKAFAYYLMELSRHRKNDGHPTECLAAEPGAGSPERAYDAAFAESLVRMAVRRAGEECRRRKLTVHWKLFSEHYWKGRPFEPILAELRVDPVRAVTMTRTAMQRFRVALRELLAREGLSGERINHEIRMLLQ